MRIKLHDSYDWCYVCGFRERRILLDINYPENAEHGDDECNYIRVCDVCISKITAFIEAHDALEKEKI